MHIDMPVCQNFNGLTYNHHQPCGPVLASFMLPDFFCMIVIVFYRTLCKVNQCRSTCSIKLTSAGVADITANPAVTSIAILGVLALALSPYVLVIGSVVLLFSAASLPGPLKKLLPAPVIEVRLIYT